VKDPLEELYRTSDARVRASFGSDARRAGEYYAPLLDFVRRLCQPSAPNLLRLLDVGCGAGWSTYAFAQAGYDAVGIDLNPQAFEAPASDRCLLREGSATDIPCAADTFDVAVCYQCLEHVPSPERALDELTRVCRPGGVVAVVGPNLVSPVPGLAYLARPSSWRRLSFRRRADMPRHPYGNTVPEILGFAALRGFQMVAKLPLRTPRFTMREPDRKTPFHADNDACYLCNPSDLIAYFRSRGWVVERRGKPGRPPLSYLLAGGTWVAARKPGASRRRSNPPLSDVLV
jgi:SAM-dependent methyltransferase